MRLQVVEAGKVETAFTQRATQEQQRRSKFRIGIWLAPVRAQ
jgi:hypothetical protein